ncbi:MAG: phage holin family protein [Hyphomicrobiales bacterium]|nr:phage holin family protein [Hyphomicrobiales bacterium]
MQNVVNSIIVGLLLLLAVIFVSIAIFYGLSPSRGPAGAAFIVALLLGAGGLIVHYAMSGKSHSKGDDFLSNPTAAIGKLTSSENIEYAQREVTRIVRQNPLKLSVLGIVAAIVLVRRI